MRINPFMMPILLVAALFGTVLAAQGMGQWSTTGRVAIDPGKMTSADLKGWMTLQEVMDGLQISQADLYTAAKLPSDVPPSTALNKLEALVPGFSVTALRDTLTAQLPGSSGSATGVPVDPITAAGADAVVSPPTPVATPVASPASKVSGETTGTGPTPLPAGQILPASQIKGSMTLRSVSEQCAVPLSQVIAGLYLPAETRPDTLIKDLVGEGKIAEVAAVQKVVASLQNQ